MTLLQTKVKLQTYTGEKVSPAGVIEVNVTYNKQHHTGKIYIVEGGGPPLLDRDWLAHIKLDWPNLLAMSMVQPSTTTEEKLKSLLAEYPDLFSDEIGELKDIKGRLTLKEDAQSVFMKVRQVPYALRPKVKAELTKLQQQNIISPVTNSEWATPIVPVLKPNGSVRICGDFKVTVNPNIKIDHYPLSRVEYVFATLSGGKRYSKLDLRQAYLHMVMDSESKKLLTINTHTKLLA